MTKQLNSRTNSFEVAEYYQEDLGLVSNEQRSQHKIVTALCYARQSVTSQTVGKLCRARRTGLRAAVGVPSEFIRRCTSGGESRRFVKAF